MHGVYVTVQRYVWCKPRLLSFFFVDVHAYVTPLTRKGVAHMYVAEHTTRTVQDLKM